VIKIDPVLILYMNEGSGTTVYDRSGWNNHGTIYNATWTKVWRDWLLSFDGVDDYVRVANSASLNLTSALTVSLWFKTSVVHDGALVWKAQSTYLPAYGVAYFGSSYGEIIGRIVDVNGNCHVVEFPWVADGVWHNLVMTYDGTTQKLYLDGVLKSSNSWTGTVITTNYDVLIGDRETYHSYFNGLIGEVRIYNRALSADEVKRAFYHEPILDGLVLWLLPQREFKGVWWDMSGKGNHGTIYGATEGTAEFHLPPLRVLSVGV